jgi:DNA polymerase-3 subunit beta
MKITNTKENLLSALKKCICAISPRPVLPVMSNIKMEAKEDRLILTTTDSELTVTTWLNALVEEEGVTTLPAKKLLQIVSILRPGDITIETTENHQSILTGQNTTYKINGLSAEDYPATGEEGDAIWSFEYKTADFVRGFAKVSYARSQDENRKQLNGVDLNIRDGLLTFAATDGRRLALLEQKLEGSAANGDYIIPSKASTELSKCLDLTAEKIRVEFREKSISFVTGNTILTTKKVEGTYPDFRKVIPEQSDCKVSLSRQALIEIINRVALIVEDNAGSIKLTFRPGQLTVSATNPEAGEAKESIEVNYENPEEISVAFNPYYFLEPLKVMDCDVATIEFGKQYNPVKLTGEEGFFYMLMPMRA